MQGTNMHKTNLRESFLNFLKENGSLEFAKAEFDWATDTLKVTKEDFLKVGASEWVDK